MRALVQDLPKEIDQQEIVCGKAYQEAMKAQDYVQAEKMLLLAWGLYPEPKHFGALR